MMGGYDTIRMRLSPMEKQVMEFETMRWLLWTYDEVECLIQSLFMGSAEGFRPGGLMEPSAKCWIPFVSKIGTVDGQMKGILAQDEKLNVATMPLCLISTCVCFQKGSTQGFLVTL